MSREMNKVPVLRTYSSSYVWGHGTHEVLSFREIAAHVSWRLPGCHLMLVHKTRVDWRGLKSSAYLILSKEYYFQFCDSQTSTNCYYHQRVNNSSDRAAQMTTRQQAACMHGFITSIYLPPLSPMP